MVIVTRSAYKRACESCDSSDVSQKNIMPPWCSSGKVYERSKSKKLATPKWEMRSTYPLRTNIWEYLYEDNVEQKFSCSNKRRHRKCKQKSVESDSCRKTAVWVILILGAVGISVSVSVWSTNATREDLPPKARITSLPKTESSSSVSFECCNRMKYLSEQLARTEQTLRNTLRSRTLMLASRTKTVAEAQDIDTRYIEGATASKGSDTTEWGGRVALWGVVPLWRAAPPPDTVLALRRPTLSDCWPFIGSYGEIIIRLRGTQRVRYVTVEHIHPDTARSAPKHFLIYGILANNTWIKIANSQYRAEGPAKQFFTLAYKYLEWKSLVFRVLTNQGNNKYTCIYRIHLYGNVDSSIVPLNKL
ncbi:SUN domain-containing protein 3-like isoform X2 [Spodoptera frugiperda]|uniref:SUN domain-containing protein 3-like isoform X2 n=1 Tax=Spodoptera frugiperda TaxID=7108 RepID=A0A9R0F6G8_SPOFR|nr:SUN domain-containing protein 3-like isoform X2 [Spodoptera frugiperda]